LETILLYARGSLIPLFNVKTYFMKKLFFPLFFVLAMPAFFSCGGLRSLSQGDAASAIRQMMQIAVNEGIGANAFNRQNILSTIFPSPISNVLNTLQTLGLSRDVDQFASTMQLAAERTAQNSIPIFINGINRMSFADAVSIIRNGGTSATDYLRGSIGSELRVGIRPVMQQALAQYNLNQQWDKITQPVRGITGNRLNLDLANLMAGLVAEAMFQKIADKEIQVRQNAFARTTPLLQRVFGTNWNSSTRF
jgi:hypothetical protein